MGAQMDGREIPRDMLSPTKANFGGDAIAMAMLFLFSYIFLLRVPSEALPPQAHRGGHSVLCIENGRLILTLQRRRGARVWDSAAI